MGGITLPTGYTYQSTKTYNNNINFRNSLKDGNDLVKLSVVDSRGNISSIIKPLNVVLYEPPSFVDLEAIRVNDIETGVRLKGTGKKYDLYAINYIKYTVSTAVWVDGGSLGTTYGPFNVTLTELTYNTDNTEFYLNSLIQGNLGASGFTFGQKFYLKIEIADAWNALYPFIYYTEVKTGKMLMSHADEGVGYGGDYDETEGGPLQILSKNILNIMHPVNEILISVNSANPATYLGFGTWVAFTATFATTPATVYMWKRTA